MFKEMETAPKDGAWIYVRYRHWWADQKRPEFAIKKVRWMMWCPKRGGELQQGWTEDGESFIDRVVDGFMGLPTRRPEAWASLSDMEK